MPLRLVRSASNRTLWEACADRFLEQVAGNPGPGGHRAHLWITHRGLRDSLLERAHDRGIEGWLAPPISFFSELPERFRLPGRPVGLLTRRRLVARLAAEHAERLGIGTAENRGVVRGHMMDGLLGELLPEGVEPGGLAESLRAVAGDDFARRRNEWVAAVYRDYLARLDEAGWFDPRSVHALLAAAIDGGGLVAAVDGAPELHVYGLHGLRSRRRLVTALARQREVRASMYVLREDEPGEWDELAEALGLEVEDLAHEGDPSTPFVQPAPDSLREYRWIAAQVKRRLVDGVRPREIAVVARQGREDTRRACTALEAAGVPCTARVRVPLCDIGALKALLELLRGVATDWSYRPLRNVLASPYFRTALDLRGVDFAAGQRRMEGLTAWADALEQLARGLDAGGNGDLRDLNVHPDRLQRDADRLRELAEELAPLSSPRPEREWVEETIRLVRQGVLDLRKRACRPVGDRRDVVRFDQRGLRHLERLLGEWAELDLPDDPLSVAEWHRLLERVLEGHELALSTPGQKGVQVVEAHDAALTPFRVLFLAHANDREFPRTESPGGMLLEEERVVLRRAGLPVADRELSLRRERTLWRAVVQGDVAITYRTTDPQGTPLLPSLMVPAHDPSRELPRSYEPVAGEGDEGRDGVVSPEEDPRLAAYRLRQAAETGEPVPVADPDALRHAIVAAWGETSRGVGDATGRVVAAPNPWHGELRDPYVLERIGDRYGPDHVWSQGQLEAYSTCPFIFLLDRVLRLRDTGEAEEETTPLTFGGVAHALLQRFYDVAKDALPPSFDPGAARLFHRVADEVFQQHTTAGEWVGLPVLWRYSREEIRTKVREYLEWELEHLAGKGERPVWCELKLEEGGDPLRLVGQDLGGSRQVMRFTGFIDRVDAQGAGDAAVYHVLDYKSSSVPARKGLGDGTVLQAPLYMEALARLKRVPVTKARYRAIKSPGRPQNGCQVVAGTPEYEHALRIAFSIPARVRAGLFEPVMAASAKWAFYHPGVEVTRGRPQLEEGSRFHG
jgi:RecB family exonuclease